MITLKTHTIVLILITLFVFSISSYAEKTDTVENSSARGYPWIAHSSLDAFYLASPANPMGAQPYQLSTYQAFTIQSLSFASFHMGLRSRETMAPNFSQPYREPASIKLASTIELLPNFVYASIGGNIPVLSDSFSINDTAALYQALNNFSPIPYSNFLSPQAIEFGLYGKFSTLDWIALAGFAYIRPGQFDNLTDHSFHPSPFMNFMGRGYLQTDRSNHRLDVQATIYSEETNGSQIPAHLEGDVFQLRYGLLRTKKRVGYQSGVGVTVRLPDANRKIKLKTNLESSSSNDNLQAMVGEFAVSWTPKPNLFWRVHILPKAFFSLADQSFGMESELGLSMGLKVWEVHRLRTSGQILVGQYMDQNYFGIGLRAEFAFRHLGFQDLEDLNDGLEREH